MIRIKAKNFLPGKRKFLIKRETVLNCFFLIALQSYIDIAHTFSYVFHLVSVRNLGFNNNLKFQLFAKLGLLTF